MREILFRGKRADNGEWVYGFYIENELFDGRLEPSITPVDEKGAALYDDDGYNIEIKVNPETVGQYIGLTDKNGKKIFEGDIVRIYYPFDAPDDCVVSWLKESAKWDLGGCDGYFCTPSKNCEIIGNIHDNPELLER